MRLKPEENSRRYCGIARSCPSSSRLRASWDVLLRLSLHDLRLSANSSAESGATSSEKTFEDVLCVRLACAKYVSNALREVAPNPTVALAPWRSYGTSSLSELEDSEPEPLVSSSSTCMVVVVVVVVAGQDALFGPEGFGKLRRL